MLQYMIMALIMLRTKKLTLETLKEISNSEDVLEVAGEYTGAIGSWGPSHEHADHRHTHDYYTSSSPQQQQQTEKQLPLN
jgi:hypothetical protein